MSQESGRGSVRRPALTRLTSIPVDEFADDYWGTKPLLSPAQGDFADLFSLAAADELVATRGIRTPFVRMAMEGTLLDASRYTSPGGFGAEVGDQLDSAKVLAEFAAGATLVLQGLHRTWAPIADFTRELSAELAAPAQVNAYITPASSRGFDPHYDVHDVFVIQIHGQKHWTIHEPVHEDPLRDQPWSDHADEVAAQASGAPAIDATFSPGDVLYLPRGWIHSATALGGTSIHLTIGVNALTRWNIVQRLVGLAAADPALRGSLPLGADYADAASLTDLIAETASRLAHTVAAADAPAVARGLATTLATSTRPEPVSPLATIESLGGLSAEAIVSWRSGLGNRVAVADDVRILLGAKTIALPIEAAEAVRALALGDEFTAGALPGLDPDSSVVVTRRLLREGVLVLR
ncbi:MAG: cupin [Microbacteriaceae bacterium]|nr:cupin [Microbacteriaceae bacterium]